MRMGTAWLILLCMTLLLLLITLQNAISKTCTKRLTFKHKKGFKAGHFVKSSIEVR